MKHEEKRALLIGNHWAEWLKTRNEVFNELSDKQQLLCCCGRLATGLHENSCSKFSHKVDAETIRRLRHLITEK